MQHRSPRGRHHLCLASRVRVHNKTLKYRPDFPDRFTSIEAARAHVQAFFRWYNTEHRHSGVAWHTPHDVHYGHVEEVRAARADTLDAAYARHPQRFVRKPPEPPVISTTVWINEPPPQQPLMISSVGQSPTEPLVLGRRQEVAQRPSDSEARLLPPTEVRGTPAGCPSEQLTTPPPDLRERAGGLGAAPPEPTPQPSPSTNP